MITGIVNTSLDSVIRFPACDVSGNEHGIEAHVDTGFDGELTLSAATIAALGLAQTAWSRVFLADGSHYLVPLLEATLVWDGQQRMVDVISATTPVPLVGTGLLRGYRFSTEMIPGGVVSISPLP